MFRNHAEGELAELRRKLEERDAELLKLKVEYAAFLAIQHEAAVRQQDAVLGLTVELQAERERARFVEQRFEQVCGVLMLLEQQVSRLISNGGGGDVPKGGITVHTQTALKS